MAWDPSPDPTVVGYKIYYGVASRTYTNVVDAGSATTVTLSNLLEGTTYYFAATAYNILGMESAFSAESVYTVPSGAGNQPPTLNPPADITINEDAGQQTVNLSGITSGATNESQTLTVTASSSNTGLIPNPTVTYTSPNTTGTLRFTPVANGNGSAVITVTVNDGGASNNILALTFNVTVNPVNDAPTLNAINNLTINESAGQQTVNLSGIGSGAANESQTLTITASSSNTGLIPNPTVNYTSPNATGTLTFTPVPTANGSATITVTVNDGGAGNNTITRTFTVTVSAVNQPPTLDPLSNLTINEDAAQQTVNLTGISSGAANENQTLQVTATSSNTGLIPNPTVTYTSPNATGSLRFTPVANANGSTTITVTVNDGGSANNTVTRTFTVTVNAVNDPPTLNALNDITVGENSGQQTVNLSGISSGAANESQTLQVTASSSNTGLIPNPTVAYTSPGATGTLRFTPVANASGTATVTVTVNDGSSSNNTVVRTFQVAVTLNSPPTITAIADQTIATNSSTAPLAFVIGDKETAASSLILSAQSSVTGLIPTNNIVFGGAGSNRTVTLTPIAGQSGTANVTITVSDGVATASTTFQLTVLGAPTAPGAPMIIVSGNGMVTPALDPQKLSMGQTYTITAIPSAGQSFSGWTGSYNSSNPQLTFLMRSNLVLQANFKASAFSAAASSFSGLFYQGDQVRLSKSGYFRVTATKHGTYTGFLKVGAKRYGISGKLDELGQSIKSIRTGRGASLALNMWIGSGSDSNQIFGEITNSTWGATMLGDRAIFNSRTNPAPYAGQFTVVIPGSGATNDPTMPAGNGYGVLRVNAQGTVYFAGVLADGTRVSQATMLSKDGTWPLYSSLYSGNGQILSWVSFTNEPQSDLNGGLTWIKSPNSKARYYPDGFTAQCQLAGSVYTPPVGANILGLTSAQVDFSGGDLASGFTDPVTLEAGSKVKSDVSHFAMSFALRLGLFHGSVADPETGRPRAFRGAVLEKMNAGYGFLLGTDQSSSVVFSP